MDVTFSIFFDVLWTFFDKGNIGIQLIGSVVESDGCACSDLLRRLLRESDISSVNCSKSL
ncbi:hypothetical protein T02_14962 [Trichinella nativa]|uniref:Uncharacterized protein n=1 Tax=Trichinella nativa TaxID=6335 RepID=A0A0V1KZ27_9BILA|nr:hypothetical protein T02_14962 [Trichinella nativa]